MLVLAYKVRISVFVYPPKEGTTAFGANQLFPERRMRVRRGIRLCSGCTEFPHFFKHVSGYDRLMRSFKIILLKLSMVFVDAERKHLCGVILLTKRISYILFVGKDISDGTGIPFGRTIRSEDSLFHQHFRNFKWAFSIQIRLENPADSFCTLRINFQLTAIF